MAKQKKNRAVIKTVIAKPPSPGQPPVYDDVEYEFSDETDVCGGGEPMTLPFFIDRVKDHYQNIASAYAAAVQSNDIKTQQVLADENIAITLGKESLMLLLSQKDCEGVRFYFCKNPFGRNSVAAVGVKVQRDKTGKPVTHNGAQVAQDIGINDDATSLLASKNTSSIILNMEVGPPYGFGQLIDEQQRIRENLTDDPFLKDLRVGLM